MTVLGSILMFVAATFAVLSPIFIGHGLSVHSGTPILLGIGVIVIAAVLTLVALRYRGARGEVAKH